MSMPLVLASGSATRAQLLTNAEVPFIVDKPVVDEEAVKASSQQAGLTAEAVAEALAELKAQRISPRHPGSLVLGADQMLACEGRWYDKPTDRQSATDQLRSLRGRRHQLITCAVMVKDSARLWHQTSVATLRMRDFSDRFLAHYLDRLGHTVTQSVGGYQLEGPGAQLFDEIKGDYFTILGLPLMPLLGFLRVHGILDT